MPMPSIKSFSALEDEPWIEASGCLLFVFDTFSFSALEDEPWIEAVAANADAIIEVLVSVLLKTSRGLKLPNRRRRR